MTAPTISLCMIVKNEEQFIEQCLKSVNDFVQEIIIVDTGSTDETINICEKYKASIYSFKWTNNFADARNFGLSKASGDWILWLDADEELEAGNEQMIIESISKTNAAMLLMPIINYYGETFPVKKQQAYLYYQPRLFRNHIGVKFYNQIHETPMLSNKNEVTESIESLKAPIHHYGYIEEITKQKNKSQRNLQTLLIEYEQPNHSPWIEYHLASEYYRKKEYNTAFLYINEAILGFLYQGLKPPALLYRLKYGMLIEMNSFDGAWPAIEKAILLYPDYVDLHFMKGLILYQKEQYSDALASFEKCLELGEGHTEYLILRGSGSFKATKYKHLCLKKSIQQRRTTSFFIKEVTV